MFGAVYQLLDDLIHETDESYLEVNNAKNALAELEAKLIKAGENIRQMAVKKKPIDADSNESQPTPSR